VPDFAQTLTRGVDSALANLKFEMLGDVFPDYTCCNLFEDKT
jgi:hypothetical protein